MGDEEEEGYCWISKEEYEEFQVLKRDRDKAKLPPPECQSRPHRPHIAADEDRKLEAKLEAMLDAKLDAVIRRAILKAATAAASSSTLSETDHDEKRLPPPSPPPVATAPSPVPWPQAAVVPEEEEEEEGGGRIQRWKRQGVDVDQEGRVTSRDWEPFYARLKALADLAYHGTVHLEWSRQDPLAFARIQRQLKAEFGDRAPWRQSWLAKKAADILRNRRHRLKAAVKRDPGTCPKKCSPTTYTYLKALVAEEEDGGSGTRKRKQIASRSLVSSRISSSRGTHRFGQGGLEVYQNRFERAYSRRPSKVELDYTAKHGHQLMCQHFGIPFHDLSKRSRHNNTHKSNQSLSISNFSLIANDEEEEQLGGKSVSERPSHLLLACSSPLSHNGDGDCGSNNGGEGK